MRPSLLDVNVLIALLDQEHVSHTVARKWLEGEIHSGWASCAITQNGFVRILSQPAYPNPVTVAEASALLASATRTLHHRFLPCDISLLDFQSVAADRLLGHRQITDAYLLALAVKHGARFVTFDANVPVAAVPGASGEDVVVLSREH